MVDEEDKSVLAWVGIAVGALVVLFVIIIGFTAAGTEFNVWRSQRAGLAKLRAAEQTRKVLVIQAQAEMEAASLRARAIEIVGAAAKAFPEYRQQEFIGAFAEALKDNRHLQVIYVPTEANIPIVEAARRIEEAGK